MNKYKGQEDEGGKERVKRGKGRMRGRGVEVENGEKKRRERR